MDKLFDKFELYKKNNDIENMHLLQDKIYKKFIVMINKKELSLKEIFSISKYIAIKIMPYNKHYWYA